MKLYMMVTKDEYELPVGVYDSVHEMARKQKVNEAYIYQAIWRYEHGKADYFVPFRRVIVEEEG